MFTCAPMMFGGAAAAVTPQWDSGTVASPLSLTNGSQRLVLPINNASIAKTVRGTKSLASGKWYWEIFLQSVVAGAGTTTGCGVVDSGFAYASNNLAANSTANAGAEWLSDRLYFSGTFTTPGIAGGFSAGDTMMFALDIGAGALWVGKNGTFVGNPAAGTGASKTGLNTSLTYYPAACPWSSDSTNAVNLDIRGQGNAIYTPPSGFTLYSR